MRPVSSFTANEREVINERRHGWEQATCALLAKVFDTSPQVIAAITKISAPLGVAPAGSAQPHPGHTPTPAVALSATTLPEGARAPNREALSGSLFNPVHGGVV